MHPELIWIKTIHFLSCLTSVAWGRYQVVYLNSLGIAPSVLGALRAAGLAAKFVAIPLWGAWADTKPASTTPLLAAVAATAALIHLYRAPTVVGSLPLLFVLKMARSAANGVGTLVDGLTLRVLERHPQAPRGVRKASQRIASMVSKWRSRRSNARRRATARSGCGWGLRGVEAATSRAPSSTRAATP